MKRTFTASVWQEGPWYVAQCLEVDVASQGETEEEALRSLAEALELHFEEPTAIVPLHREVSVGTLRSIIKQAGLTPGEFEVL